MASPDAEENTYDKLRTLAARNPRDARKFLTELLANDSLYVQGLFQRASTPGEGRVRQLIANTVRLRRDRDVLLPQLAQWLDFETDEFARRAIRHALSDADYDTSTKGTEEHDSVGVPAVDQKMVEIFRYVSGRLTHRVQNAVFGASAPIMKLRRAANKVDDLEQRVELLSTVSAVDEAFLRISRIVEFSTDDDDFFRIRRVLLVPWIESMHRDYCSIYGPITLSVDANGSHNNYTVLASDFLLRMIFWNLWENAQQSVDDPCKVVIQAALKKNKCDVVVLDNGPGFPKLLKDDAFLEQVSTRGADHGRGLLEVADAMARIHGAARLVPVESYWRVMLTFPLIEP